MRKAEKLRWMSEQELIDQLDSLPGNSPVRTIQVPVTEYDCEHSQPGKPTKCAISAAMRRLLPRASFVCTRHDGMTVTIDGRYLHFDQSQKGSRFIQEFDALGAVRPTTLTYHLVNVEKVSQHTPERKAQINDARRKRAQEGRPDKVYHVDPMRMRTTKSAKEKARTELRAAIEKAKRGAAIKLLPA